MTEQLHYLQNYQKMVAEMLAAYPEDQAMELAVGGNYEHFGVLEHALLRVVGMQRSYHVVDVGCGSGRLAAQLSRYPALRYSGFDIVPALVDYARRKVGREDFHFGVLDRNALPLEANSADFVTFFSVFTHILHEESYVYLAEAARVLRPGGRVVFSFLEFAMDGHWHVFEANVDWVRQRRQAGHLNVFMHRADLKIWAQRLGLNVVMFRGGDQPFILVDRWSATEKVPAGAYALGQSVCVLEKAGPAAG